MPSDDTPSDEALFETWRGGDRRAGHSLFLRHFEGIRRFFINKIDDKREVEELVSETFRRCTEKADDFRREAVFRTFLFGIARFTLLEFLRRRYLERRIDFDAEVDSVVDLGAGPSTIMSRDQQQRLLLEALRRIPIAYQLILELYFWERMTAVEIAEILEVGEGAVRGRLRKAKRLLAEAMQTIESSPQVLESTLDDLERWSKRVRDSLDMQDDRGLTPPE